MSTFVAAALVISPVGLNEPPEPCTMPRLKAAQIPASYEDGIPVRSGKQPVRGGVVVDVVEVVVAVVDTVELVDVVGGALCEVVEVINTEPVVAVVIVVDAVVESVVVADVVCVVEVLADVEVLGGTVGMF